LRSRCSESRGGSDDGGKGENDGDCLHHIGFADRTELRFMEERWNTIQRFSSIVLTRFMEVRGPKIFIAAACQKIVNSALIR
jgi:hypothetical protein